MPPSYEIECPNYKTGCDIENCPRLLENIDVTLGKDGELVGSGFCTVKGGRYFGGIGHEKIKVVCRRKTEKAHPSATTTPVGEFKPIKFEWRGPIVERFKELEKRLTPEPDPWTADNDIDYVAYCALDYYRVLTDWVCYLRGETDEAPEPIKDPNGVGRNAGDWMIGTITPTILDHMKRLIENLPSLNTPDGKYPFKRIDQMFEDLNLLALILNHCEEELKSDEGARMGLAAIRNLELHKLACPEKPPFGKVILERKLIAVAFERFYKAFCGAAWALKDKVAKRESGKIDLAKLDKDIIMQQDKNHPEYELLQIEVDTLYCLPEASPWLFLRICRVMSKALERAKDDLDVELPNYRWFAEGLSLIVRGLGHATGDENEIGSDRVDVREALRNLVSALIRWQTMCMTNGMVNSALIENIFKSLTLPYGDLDEETPGAYDRFIEDMFFEGSEDCLYYRPGPLKGILEPCEDKLVDWKLLPEDITSHVCANSIYFIEENGIGWYDEDRDEFMSNAITRIYNTRHPKADDPSAEHEHRLAEYLKESLKEAAVDIMERFKNNDAVLRKLDDFAQNQKSCQEEFRGALEANTKATTNLGRKVDAEKSDVKTIATGLATIFPKLGACTEEDAKKAFGLKQRYVGLDKIPSTVHRSQIKAAIDFSYKEGVAVHMPKQNGTTKHPTVTDLAKTVWDLNQDKWQIIPDSYKTLTDYTSALLSHFKKYPDSLLHAD